MTKPQKGEDHQHRGPYRHRDRIGEDDAPADQHRIKGADVAVEQERH